MASNVKILTNLTFDCLKLQNCFFTRKKRPTPLPTPKTRFFGSAAKFAFFPYLQFLAQYSYIYFRQQEHQINEIFNY